MNEDSRQPHRRPETLEAEAERRERAAAQLRANLARRKAQSRERAGATKTPKAPDGTGNAPA